MTKGVKLLICSLWIAQLCYCQQTYPQRQVLPNKDTVCIISSEQVRLINEVFFDRAEYNQINDSLNAIITNYDSLTVRHALLTRSLGKQIILQSEMLDQKDVIISNDTKTISKLKTHRRILIVVCAVLGIAAIL